MIYFYGFIVFLVVVVVILLGIDFTRFIVAKNKTGEPMGVKCAAGGILFVQGRKTYYTMPGGERRKIADFRMDLKPGSKDMNEFTRIMDQAARSNINEGRESRRKSKESMQKLAKDLTHGK
jgi:hypothetical protein